MSTVQDVLDNLLNDMEKVKSLVKQLLASSGYSCDLNLREMSMTVTYVGLDGKPANLSAEETVHFERRVQFGTKNSKVELPSEAGRILGDLRSLRDRMHLLKDMNDMGHPKFMADQVKVRMAGDRQSAEEVPLAQLDGLEQQRNAWVEGVAKRCRSEPLLGVIAVSSAKRLVEYLRAGDLSAAWPYMSMLFPLANAEAQDICRKNDVSALLGAKGLRRQADWITALQDVLQRIRRKFPSSVLDASHTPRPQPLAGAVYSCQNESEVYQVLLQQLYRKPGVVSM